ncbi:hypothetical protein V6N13_048333 [Hibiscus sabdariffa]|uniref:Uncharacterized protein n=1 Tax=Hibiscus sabdariffa TaxID=183260 RepID=A0ABR2F6Y8_9ROSI
MLSRNQVSGTPFYTFFSSQFIESNGLLLVCHSQWCELSPREATSVSICESSLVVEDGWFRAIERRGSLGHLTVSSGFSLSVIVSGGFHCRDGFCCDNGLDQFPVAKRLIVVGRNEGELSVKELFLVWRFERFRKNKFGLLRWFLFGSLVALRYLRRSGFTTISSLSSLFWVKIQMLVFGRRGDEVLAKAKGSCDRANGEEGAVTAASTKSTIALGNAEGRYHAIYVFGKGYKTRAFSSLLIWNGTTRLLPYASVFGIFLIPKVTSFVLGYENPKLAMDFCLCLVSLNCFKIWPVVPDIMHTLTGTSLHVSLCRMSHVSLYD